MSGNWIEIGLLDDIPVLGSRVVKTSHGDVAVFRNAEDQLFALHDKCPHKGGPLSQGIVHGTSVTCPLHSWVIGLENGEAKGNDRGCAKSFHIKLSDGRVFLDVQTSMRKAG
jgi:nitrite reductase (NADH) small subunit